MYVPHLIFSTLLKQYLEKIPKSYDYCYVLAVFKSQALREKAENTVKDTKQYSPSFSNLKTVTFFFQSQISSFLKRIGIFFFVNGLQISVSYKSVKSISFKGSLKCRNTSLSYSMQIPENKRLQNFRVKFRLHLWSFTDFRA